MRLNPGCPFSLDHLNGGRLTYADMLALVRG
jgi:hypothetical protein